MTTGPSGGPPVSAVQTVLRVAAYGICIEDDRLLLAHYVSPDGAQRHWTLPGGKVEHGEDPFHTVVRELAEETGYGVQVTKLLGVDSRLRHVDWIQPRGGELHSIGIFYAVLRSGGDLRAETAGSTDGAEWFPLSEVSALPRASLVDIGLDLSQTQPASGHVRGVPVTGPLRH